METVHSTRNRLTTCERTAVALCIAVLAAWILNQFFFRTNQNTSSPVWLQPAAAILAAVGITRLAGATWGRVSQALHMAGLLLMVWAANGLVFDFLRMLRLIGDPATGLPAPVDWPGTIVRALALAAAIVLARLALTAPSEKPGSPPAGWYGYAAFLLALPYPVFRLIWAFGGTPGIAHAGDAGEGFKPVIVAIPWMLAAILSLLLVSPGKWKPRRLLLAAGWTATAIVASIGPSAIWSLIAKLFSGDQLPHGDIAVWVYCLFYGSWFLWAIAAFAATRSYQLRSAGEKAQSS